MSKQYYIYMMSNKKDGTIYTGFTSNIEKRIWEHKNKVIKGFTQKYNLKNLVYFEIYNDPENAIKRENPHWLDLYPSFYGSFDQVEG